MDDRPQARDAVLAAFSKALREGYGGGEDPELSINLIVRKNNEIIFLRMVRQRGKIAVWGHAACPE